MREMLCGKCEIVQKCKPVPDKENGCITWVCTICGQPVNVTYGEDDLDDMLYSHEVEREESE